MNPQILRRLKEAKKATLLDVRKPHTCSLKLCNPQCERDFGLSDDSTIFLCNYGSIHVCGVDVCKIYSVHTGTCPLSGMVVGPQRSSDYAKDDPRTWRAAPEPVPTQAQDGNIFDEKKNTAGPVSVPPPPPPPSKKVRTKNKKRERQQEDIEDSFSSLVDLLLYSSHRARINQAELERNQRDAAQARNTYIATCKEQGRFPFLTDIVRIFGHFSSKALPLNELEREPKKVQNYVKILSQVWDIAKRFYKETDEPKMDAECVALGALYMMRNGYEVRGIKLLPKDLFLFCNLPPVNKLTVFRLKKKNVTRGEKVISIVYNNAFEARAPLDEFTLKPVVTDDETKVFKSTSRKNNNNV